MDIPRCIRLRFMMRLRFAWPSGMRAPRRRRQQLHLLRHDERPEPGGEAFHEVLVGEHARPVLSAVCVVVEFPEMDKLIDRAGVALEVADQLLVVATFLKCGKAELLIELGCFGHLADVQRISSHLVENHCCSPFESTEVCLQAARLGGAAKTISYSMLLMMTITRAGCLVGKMLDELQRGGLGPSGFDRCRGARCAPERPEEWLCVARDRERTLAGSRHN